MPAGMPISNSLRTSRRRTTAITQAAIVTQDNRTGNQPPTIEMLPTFTVVARIAAPMATAAAAPAARIQRRDRARDRGGLVLCWLVVSVWVLMAGVFLRSARC